MFVHGGLMHLALNMWTLWLFGPRVERAWGASTFTWFYLWCGVGGWAAHYMFQKRRRSADWRVGGDSGCRGGVRIAVAG